MKQSAKSQAKIEQYLDNLQGRLYGPGPKVRRVMQEVQTHLEEATAENRSKGMQPDAAADDAIKRFGAPDYVAKKFLDAGYPGYYWQLAQELFRSAWLVGTVAFITLAISGLLATGLRSVKSDQFVAGDLPGVTYTAQRCADYYRLAPGKTTCSLAAATHHADEVTQYRITLGLLGLLSLGAFWLNWRLYKEKVRFRLLPGGFTMLLGAGLAGAVALITLLLSLDYLAGGGNGAGIYLTDAAAAALACLGFGYLYLKNIQKYSI